MPPAAFKESSEPFLSDLLQYPGLPPIKAIWTYDVVSFGQSFLLNKNELGEVNHWHDSGRDLIQLVNHFQDHMQPPIIGFGQSWGAVSIIMAASWSPRLFHSIILSEPVVENAHFIHQELRDQGLSDQQIYARDIGRRFASRKTQWTSMDDARKSLLPSFTFKQYDPRVQELIFKHEFVQNKDGSVESIPPNPQIVSYFMRPIPPLPGIVPNPEDHVIQAFDMTVPGFGHNQSALTHSAMQSISCQILYLWATDETFISTARYRERVLSKTGTGPGGAGGKATGQVEEVFVEGGHSLPYFVPTRTAEAVGKWLRDRSWWSWVEKVAAFEKEPPIRPFDFSEDFMARLDKSKFKL